MSRQDSPRVQPLEPPYDPAVAAGLQKWMPRNAQVEPLRLFRTLLQNRALSDAMHPLGEYVLGRHLQLTLREREIIIDRTCARTSCEYEWGVHVVAFGGAAAMSDQQLLATTSGELAGLEWTESDKLLIRIVDELHDTSTISDALWEQVSGKWQPQQVLEMLVIVGWYHAISYVANAARIQPETWARRFP